MSKPKREVIAPSSPKQEMMLNTDADISILGGAAGCLLPSAEFLSDKGWKRIDQYVEGDKVAQYNTDNDTLTFKEPVSYVKLPSNGFKRMVARGLDFILSPEHKVLYWNEGQPKAKTLPFSEVVARHEKSLTKGWTGAIKTTFQVKSSGLIIEGNRASPELLRLMVAIQADGSVCKSGGKVTYIRFSKDRKDIRMRQVLDAAGVEYVRSVREMERYSNGTQYEYKFILPCGVKTFDGDFYQCDQEQLEAIVDESQYWDGSTVKNQNGNTIRFSNNCIKTAEFMQYAYHACGYNTSFHIDSRDNPNISDNYQVNASLRGKGFRRFANKDGKCEVVDYPCEDGYKYCFETETGFFLVRQNNKVFITGNSGKSFIALLHPLKHVNDKYFRGVIFRKTNAELKSQGGLFENAVEIYSKVFGLENLRIQQNELKITFPTGATLKFSYLENDADCLKHQGAQYSFVLFDESSHFNQYQIEYLYGRIRSARAKHRLQMVMTCNPDPDWFALEWIKPYLNEDGTPDLTKDGMVRYYVVDNGTYIWSDDFESLNKRYPNQKPSSFTFISANCTDNIPLMEADPSYVGKLMAREWVEVQRLYYGRQNCR